MKKVFGILLILVLIGAGLLGYVAFNAGALLEKYKPEIEKKISETLKTPVSLGALSLSIFPETKVHVEKVSVGSASQKDGFALNDLYLHVRLIPLLSGDLQVVKLSLDRPEISFIKENGMVKIAGLPTPEAAKTTPVKKDEPVATKKETLEGASIPFTFNLEQFELTRGKLTFIDKEAKKEIVVSDISLSTTVDLKDSSLSLPALLFSAKLFDKHAVSVEVQKAVADLKALTLDAPSVVVALLGNTINIGLKYQVKEQTGAVSINSPGLSLASFAPLAEPFTDALTKFAVGGKVTPQISIQLAGNLPTVSGSIKLSDIEAKANELVSVSKINGSLNLKATLVKQEISTENLAVMVNNAPLTVSLKAGGQEFKKFDLNSLNVKGFGGEIAATATATLPRFSSDLTVKTIKLDQVAGAVMPALSETISGTLDSFTVGISGALGDDLMNSLTGKGSILLQNASLKNVNILNQVLAKTEELPGGGLLALVPEQYKAQVTAKDTAIKSLRGTFNIGRGAVTTPDLTLEHALFTLLAEGGSSLQGELDLNATIALIPQLSAALAERNKNIGKVLDTDGRLVIPLTIAGKAPKIIVVPNLKKLIELAAKRALQDKAGDLLQGFLGGKKNGKKAFGF